MVAAEKAGRPAALEGKRPNVSASTGGGPDPELKAFFTTLAASNATTATTLAEMQSDLKPTKATTATQVAEIRDGLAEL